MLSRWYRTGVIYSLDIGLFQDANGDGVERMVRQVRGVIGVTDTIVVKPSASPQSVQAVIEEIFKREAAIDARHVRVEVSDHTAKLYGHVHTLQEANAASAAAAAVRGISRVESHLVISS